MKNCHRIGVDLGGTKVEVVLLDQQGETVLRERAPSNSHEGYEAMLMATADMIRLAQRSLPQDAEHTVGLGIPGAINPFSGLIQNANSVCLNDQPFKVDLERELGREVAMVNDANCFTLAEAMQGSATGYDSVFGVIMGTGCGGGIYIGGQIHHGMHRMGGEWGHMVMDPKGADCYCGNRGCVETMISGTGVENRFQERFGRSLKMQDIVAGARSGDADCAQAFETFLDDFGRCLGGLVSVLDPDCVVLGGGLSNIPELYTRGVEHMRRYAFHSDLRTPVLENGLGDSAGVFGAAWLGV